MGRKIDPHVSNPKSLYTHSVCPCVHIYTCLRRGIYLRISTQRLTVAVHICMCECRYLRISTQRLSVNITLVLEITIDLPIGFPINNIISVTCMRVCKFLRIYTRHLSVCVQIYICVCICLSIHTQRLSVCVHIYMCVCICLRSKVKIAFIIAKTEIM